MNPYDDNKKTRITSYFFIKKIQYKNHDSALAIAKNLAKLQETKFDFIHVPNFTFEINGNNLTIESEFIKGWHFEHMPKIYDDLISKDWTFADPHPSNFITCKKTLKTYIVDFDSFQYIPSLADRRKTWMAHDNTCWIIYPPKFYGFDENGIKEQI
jgi:hypothetical protein